MFTYDLSSSDEEQKDDIPDRRTLTTSMIANKTTRLVRRAIKTVTLQRRATTQMARKAKKRAFMSTITSSDPNYLSYDDAKSNYHSDEGDKELDAEPTHAFVSASRLLTKTRRTNEMSASRRRSYKASADQLDSHLARLTRTRSAACT